MLRSGQRAEVDRTWNVDDRDRVAVRHIKHEVAPTAKRDSKMEHASAAVLMFRFDPSPRSLHHT